uniref:Arrestin C-terminal-like domain-containing protein n=2 Tax=Tetranychus urticae TaxID=32264 RepID=T1KJN6_TETUR
MFTSGNYSSSLVSIESQEGCPINPGSTLSKTFVVTPKFNGVNGRGIAIENALPGEDKKLATSTLLSSEQSKEDVFGIQVSYCVRIKLQMGALAGEMVGELPFLLMPQSAKAAIGDS